jgi:hypothetical protein
MTCFWNNLHQVRAWHVSGITFIRLHAQNQKNGKPNHSKLNIKTKGLNRTQIVLSKIILPPLRLRHNKVWWYIHVMHVHVPDEGYSRNMSWMYLMKVIPETCHARTCTWWRLFQKHLMHVPDEGYSRNMSCTYMYLMKVLPETCHARTWWGLFQKHEMHVHVPDEGYSRNMKCTYMYRMKVMRLREFILTK